MILYALYVGLAVVGVSYVRTIWRLVNGSGITDGEWVLDMISVNAVVMVLLLGVCLGL